MTIIIPIDVIQPHDKSNILPFNNPSIDDLFGQTKNFNGIIMNRKKGSEWCAPITSCLLINALIISCGTMKPVTLYMDTSVSMAHPDEMKTKQWIQEAIGEYEELHSYEIFETFCNGCGQGGGKFHHFPSSAWGDLFDKLNVQHQLRI